MSNHGLWGCVCVGVWSLQGTGLMQNDLTIFRVKDSRI